MVSRIQFLRITSLLIFHQNVDPFLVVSVTLETLDKKNCQLSVSSVEMNFTTMNTPPKSLVFQVYQYAPTQNVSYMEVYVDCLYRGSIPFNKTFRDITETKDRPAIRVVRI